MNTQISGQLDTVNRCSVLANNNNSMS
jgi:hypothetical protein